MPLSPINPLPFALAWGVPTSGLLLLGALALLCLGLVAGRGRRRPGFDPADYRAKSLLSAWEAKALAEIQADLPRGYHVCPQVRLADAIEIVQRDPSLRLAALGRVAQKSVDFAVIDGQGRVALVIELDDRSHQRPDRRRRDEMVDAVLAHCGILIKRIRPGQRECLHAPEGAGHGVPRNPLKKKQHGQNHHRQRLAGAIPVRNPGQRARPS